VVDGPWCPFQLNGEDTYSLTHDREEAFDAHA
jgi:hypothetical protein